MKILFALLLMVLPANAGSLSLNYSNTAGTINFNTSATVTDADAATMIAWCEQYFNIPTAQACFNKYADMEYTKLQQMVLDYQRSLNAVAPITLTPSQ